MKRASASLPDGPSDTAARPTQVGHERLLVFREEALSPEPVCRALAEQGYAVAHRAFGVDAWGHVLRTKPALILLVGASAPFDENSSLAYLRARTARLPILVVAPCSAAHRVQCLTRGADDIVDHLVAPRELVARVQAVLRRYGRTVTPACRFQLGSTRIDLRQRLVRRGDSQQRLTEKECILLHVLLQRAGHPVAREQLIRAIHGMNAPTISRSLETHVWRLRRKLGEETRPPCWLKSVPGFGYQLDTSSEGTSALPADV